MSSFTKLKTKSYIDLIRILWSFSAKKRKYQFYGLILLMFIASFAEAISIGLVIPFIGILSVPEKVYSNPLAAPIITFLDISSSQELVWPLTVLFVLVVILSSGIRIILMYFQIYFGNILGFDYGLDIYKKTLYQPYHVHLSRNTSEVIVGISQKVNALVSNIIMPLMTIFSSLIIIFSIMVTLFIINPKVASIVFCGFAIIYGCIVAITKRTLYFFGEIVNKEQVNIHKFLQEGLSGIRDILINGTQISYIKIYKKADFLFRTTISKIQIIAHLPKFFIEAIGLIVLAFAAYYLLKNNNNILTTLPLLGAYGLGAQKLLPFLQSIFYGITNMRGSKAILCDILELLKQPMPNNYLREKPTNIQFKDRILLKNISFRYNNTQTDVLQALDISIKKGSKIGIIGKTGSGKSTLLDIIMGLLSPSKGELYVDHKLIKQSNLRNWQNEISHVPQSIFLSDASIAENIAFGTPYDNINFKKVKEAAKLAMMDSTIQSWSNGYNTNVGERGIRISGGQRQRIGIARAFYQNKKILIFDEATSSLDSKTETNIMDNINKLDNDITMIIVAHRLTTLSKCSKILELEKGKLLRTTDYQNIN